MGNDRFLLVALRAARAAEAAVGLGINRGVVPTVTTTHLVTQFSAPAVLY